jgi:hypothetical protein
MVNVLLVAIIFKFNLRAKVAFIFPNKKYNAKVEKDLTIRIELLFFN